jgi:hypothetical protein
MAFALVSCLRLSEGQQVGFARVRSTIGISGQARDPKTPGNGCRGDCALDRSSC